jgi:pyridoxine 5-phosphate synthase
MGRVRLHVNIDHIATVRQARRETFPDPIAWALACEAAGADGITCHLRFDRRHIQDDDLRRLREAVTTPLNLELALTPEMVGIALESGAELYCLVPESREEVTTEGGLNVRNELERVREVTASLTERGGIVSAFIDPDEDALTASAEAGCRYIELHTGSYANAAPNEIERELERLHTACERAHALGLGVNAGHGLTLANVAPIARLPHIEELNIGYALVSDALTIGVTSAVRNMKTAITEATA